MTLMQYRALFGSTSLGLQIQASVGAVQVELGELERNDGQNDALIVIGH
jgi:hypothetical protein